MGHGKRVIVLQNVGSTLSPNKRCAKSNRPNGIQSQLLPPVFMLSPPTGKAVLRHHLLSIPCMSFNCGGVMTKVESFPPLNAIHHKDDPQEQSVFACEVPKRREIMKPQSKPSKSSELKFEPLQDVEKTAQLSLKKPNSRSPEDPFREVVNGYRRQGARSKGQRSVGGSEGPILDQDFEYYMKKDHSSGLKARRRYVDLRERRSILDKRSSKRLWTQEAITEGVNQYHWQQTDEKDIQEAVHRNYKGRFLVRKKDQAIKHLLDEKLVATPKKTYTHRKPTTRRRRRKSHITKKAEITDGVSETIRPRRQWNIRSRHHFRSFDHRRLRRKPKVFDFIFEKMKPCLKARHTKSNSVGYDHFGSGEQDVRVQEDVLENSDAQILPPIAGQAVQLVEVLNDAKVTVEQASVNVSLNRGLTELEVAARETKITSEANKVLADGALIHSEEELISLQKMVVQKAGNFVEPAATQMNQVTKYSDLWENLKSSSGVATKSVDVSEIPANHNVPPHPITEQVPRVLKKKNSRTGFDIYRDTNKVPQQIMGNQSRIPVSIARRESPTDRHGILMDKQNVNPSLAKTRKAKMYSKIPVAVEPVQMCSAPQPTTRAVAQQKTLRSSRSSGTLIGRPGSNQENMAEKSTSGSHEVPRAVKVKPRREADPRKRAMPPKKPFY